MIGEIKERKGRLHGRGEEMAGLQRGTFSWRPPTERRIGTDSEREMVRNEKRGADGYRGIGGRLREMEIERNAEGDCQTNGKVV